MEAIRVIFGIISVTRGLEYYWNLVNLSLQGSGTERQVYVYRYLKKAICDTYFAATGE